MRQWTVDAFASEPFKGNPACVVEPFDTWPPDAWMQALAQENNQAETAFLLRTCEADRFGLRWMTPTTEVDLCGHATLASAHALMAEMRVEPDRLRFETRWGELAVRRLGAGYEMDFPADPPVPAAPPDGLAEALGFTPLEVLKGNYWVAVAPDAETVRRLVPDLEGVRRACQSLIVVAATGEPIISRFFAPGIGIAEDPTTGSAHCLLAPMFSARRGKATLAFHQAYPGRGGDLVCEVVGDRVLLRGQAVTVVESELRISPK